MLRVIGLMSGTSVDGIDAALVEISGSTDDLQVRLVAGVTYSYPATLRSKILAVCSGEVLSIPELADLDDAIAQAFAQAALHLQAKYPPADLIGSHGQTVFHRPPAPRIKSAPPSEDTIGVPPSAPRQPIQLGYSLQLGRGDLIAHLTGITTVSNFRAADIALGGQGAPLVPPIDACLLSHPLYSRCVQNIGGIGNVTYLPARSVGQPSPPVKGLSQTAPIETKTQGTLTVAAPSATIIGWDTGPGNMLLDLAVQHFSNGRQSYDQNGAWAATGVPCSALLQQWLAHPFFHAIPPKSTGRELFGSDYWQQCLAGATQLALSPADVLATLTELTAVSIAHSYRTFLPQMPDQVLLCGGGSQNQYLKQRLQINLDPIPVLTTDEVGLNADFKEAIAFAVLAYWRRLGIPGNLPEVTGASQTTLLGEIYPASVNFSVLA
jgi:anhydro-N-acetylmuramic acid kinase